MAGSLRFPPEVLFRIELFISVRDVASLSGVSRVTFARATQRHWQRLFIARWGSQYATEGEGTAALTSTRVSARILGGLSEPRPWRGFWITVEKAFIGHENGGILGTRAQELDQSRALIAQDPGTGSAVPSVPASRRSSGWLLSLFRLVQPPATPAQCSSSSRGAYRAFQGQPGSAADAAAAAAAPSAPWHLACLLREARRADVILCRVCDEMDVLTREMRDWEALPTQFSSFVAPCACAMVAHRGCLEQSILLGGGGGSCCIDGAAVGGSSSVGSSSGSGEDTGGAASIGGAEKLPALAASNAVAAATDVVSPSTGSWLWRLGLAVRAAARLPSFGPKNWISFDDTERSNVQRFLDPSGAVDVADFAAATGLNGNGLSRRAAAGGAGGGSAIGGSSSGWGAVTSYEEAAAANRYHCRRCGCKYKLGWRLPGSMRELVRVTCCDPVAWHRFGSVIANWLALVAGVHALERWREPAAAAMAAHPEEASAAAAAGAGGGGCGGCGGGLAWPEPGGLWLLWWLLQQVVLLQVFFSPRFTLVVAQLWRGPIFSFYCRLYLYFAFACLLFTLTWTPLLPRAVPRLVGPGNVLPPWLVAVGWANASCYAVVSSIVIFLFWKTQYRIATVAEGKQSAATTHPILHLRTA